MVGKMSKGPIFFTLLSEQEKFWPVMNKKDLSFSVSKVYLKQRATEIDNNMKIKSQ